jgi:hypothetical protein
LQYYAPGKIAGMEFQPDCLSGSAARRKVTVTAPGSALPEPTSDAADATESDAATRIATNATLLASIAV